MTMQRKKIAYTVACVSEFAKAHQLDQASAFQYLDRFQGISFLTDCYEAEHTLSFQDAVEDLTFLCKKNGGWL